MLRSFFILLCFVFTSVYAQNSDFKVVFVNPKTGLPGMLRFNPVSNNIPNAENLDIWMRQNLFANSAFRMKYVRSKTGSDAINHLRYQQYFGRFKVEAGELILHVKNNKAISLNGKYFPQLDLDTSISISPENAISNALKLFPNAVFMWEVASEQALLKKASSGKKTSYYPKPELFIISLNDSFRNSDFRLAYKLDIYVHTPHSRQWIYIDANTGEVIDTEEQICTIDRVGIAHTKYAGIQTITCDSFASDSFRLLDMSRGNGIETIDVRIINLDSSRDFIDHDNIWNNVNSFKDEVATDAHWGTEKTYDYFKEYHNRLSYDDSDGYILSKVHVGNNLVNAFWGGEIAHYGDGNPNYNPLTSIDIVAHELTHGVTQYSARLRYRNESGALNESFSDIFAKHIEMYADSANFDWLIAGKITKNNKPFRDLSNPLKQGQPKYYYGKSYYDGDEDNGGVHTNSGVQNYWFYLLCNGGSGIREIDSLPYTVGAIGMDKAAQIAYLNLTSYLIRESEYVEAAFASVDAAEMLFGLNSYEYRQVQWAWFAVGLLDFQYLNVDQTSKVNAAWNLYPNPAQNILFVQNPLVYESSSIEILDITGKVLMQTQVLPNEAIQVETLSAGIYFIRINGTTVLKWIKS